MRLLQLRTMTMQFKRTTSLIGLGFILAGIVSCANSGSSSPLFVELDNKEGVRLILFGTFHELSTEEYSGLDDYLGAVRTTIETSDLVLLETLVPAEIEAAKVVQRVQGKAEVGRPSIKDMISNWSPERRDAFLDGLNRFPGLAHVGRQERILAMRPWAFWTIFLPDHLANTLGSGSGAPHSVDSWVSTIAAETRVEIRGLESFYKFFDLADSGPQNNAMDRIESMLSSSIVRDGMTLARQFSTLRETLFGFWREGLFYDQEAILSFYDSLGVDRTVAEDDPLATYVANEREQDWVESLIDLAGSQTPPRNIFVAIGLDHLNPEKSILIESLVLSGFEIVDVVPKETAKLFFRE